MPRKNKKDVLASLVEKKEELENNLTLDSPQLPIKEMDAREMKEIKDLDSPQETNEPKDEKLPDDLFPQFPPLRTTLRNYITATVFSLPIIFSLLYLLFSSILKFPQSNLFSILLIASLVVSLLTSLLIRAFLNPIDKIYQAIVALSKGELNQNIESLSSNELGDIAREINNLSFELKKNSDQVFSDKEFTTSEKNKLIDILSAMKEALIVVDQERNVLLMNKMAQRIAGVELSEVKDKGIDTILHIYSSSGQPILSEEYCPIKNSTSQTLVYESNQPLKLINKAGAQTNIAINSSVIESSNSTLGCVISIKDTSKQKELNSMQIDFVSMASHELRTPLTSIKGYMSVFLNENKDKLNKEQKDFLEKVMISTQQLTGLIDNLLNVAKVERGAITVNTQPFDWGQLLNQEVSELQLQASEKNIHLNLEKLPSNLPQVQADAVRVTEVLGNLLTNAINYTQEGGEVNVAAKLNDNMVVTSVTDNGNGISPDDLPHLFTKFFRVQGALDTASNSKGTGLGLYLSKSIIELHKGKIWAESAGLGKGAVFYFSLPLAQKVSVREKLTPLETPKLSI